MRGVCKKKIGVHTWEGCLEGEQRKVVEAFRGGKVLWMESREMLI